MSTTIFPMQEEIVPLTGMAYFSVIATSRNIGPTFYQLVPPVHIREMLPVATAPLVLSCQNKRWEVIYKGDCSFKSFQRPGWKKFVLDNNVRLGDALVFELIDCENVELKVQILRSDDPPKSLEGTIADAPVIID